ncbi:MAG: NAD(+) synthase [Bacteroidales bacterium]|nr:NAD(+) synthase [Bacteroidales bacterium]MBR4679471.1 NAD(+) synthase [Bacteroidales bacterium]
MKIRYSQITIVPGNPALNFETCRAAAERAKKDGVNLLLLPEMSIPGYMIGDRWEENDFIEDCEFFSKELAKEADENFSLIFGTVAFFESVYGSPHNGYDGRKAKMNVALIATNGKTEYRVKTLLPNYREFEEPRHFFDNLTATARASNITEDAKMFPLQEICGVKFGVTICEDGWDDDYYYKPFDILSKAGAEILINISYSPFTAGKNRSRNRHFANHAKNLNKPVIYVNGLGLQNNGKTVFCFDGSSAAWNSKGELIAHSKMYEEEDVDFQFVDGELFSVSPLKYKETSEIEDIHKTLIYGIRNYMKQSGLKKVVIGASGGVDSTLAAALYAEAIGKENLLLVNMPTKFNSQTTIGIAQKLAANLGCWYTSVPVSESAALTKRQIDGLKPTNSKGENIEINLSSFNMENVQARDRGSRILAAIASAWGAVFTNNGNKTETTVGYATLYGDVAGFLAALGDLWKHTVYDLCRYINREKEIVPKEVLTLKPSAELSENQAVDKGLGDPIIYPYHDRLFEALQQWWNRAPLDGILQHYLDGDLAAYLNHGEDTELTEDLIKTNFPDAKSFTADLERWYKLFKGMGVAKRIQAPPIIAVTRRAYGFDYRESAIQPYFTRKYLELKEKALNQN